MKGYRCMEREDPPLEPTLDVELSPMMEPESITRAATSSTPPGRYWQAQGLADMLRHEFDEAQRQGKPAVMRERFYLLANYYTRTSAILRYALKARRESLAQAALHNLIALHKSLNYMYKIAPGTVPSTLTLSRDVRPRLIENLIVQVLQEGAQALDVTTITRGVNDKSLLVPASEKLILHHLNNLLSTGHVQHLNNRYIRTTRAYSSVDLDQVGLQTLVGATLYAQMDRAGFHGLTDITTRKDDFRRFFEELTGFSDGTAALLLAATEALEGSPSETKQLSPWRHVDLIGSPHIRPYQYEAYAIFRGYGYRGQVIEAPTGSGKTMIGMMCIQDWLRSMPEGQSILVLVPTVNYQQQWVGELCYKPFGLRLSSHQVFTGTPASLETVRKHTAIMPCVIVMTYTALAQTGSGKGKGGFDQDSIEMFLQGNNIQYVIFDEVHKVVEDVHSVSADVTHVLMEWVQDGSLKGAIGFSGTAAAYRARFAQLGLKLVYILSAAELIAYGFVAPFSECGVPFAYSDREQRIRNLLDAYKALLRDFVTLIGSANLRLWFSETPMEERVMLGRNLLRMYGGANGQKERGEALVKRFESWERGGELSLTELPLISLVQLARGWSDKNLVRATTGIDAHEGKDASADEEGKMARFHEILHEILGIRNELKSLIYLAETLRRLNSDGFGTTFDVEAIHRLATEATSNTTRAERVKDGLATTIAGLYSSLSDWYLRVGEGRVDSIKAIIGAERAVRPVHGVIVFDVGTRIRWQSGISAPGYGGVAGVFSQMLGDERFIPMAVLSSEIYMAYSENDPLPERIATMVQRDIMLGELGDALFGLTTQGLDLKEDQLVILRKTFIDTLAQYVGSLEEVKTARLGEFYRKVLVPVRKAVRKAKLGTPRDRLLARLSLKQFHVRNCVTTFFDYALIVEDFRSAHVAMLEQVSGTQQKFFVVKMAHGDRRQLMYDLTARIVDAEDIPVNLVIVSPWARTGWNVIKPNVLIDATATRDVTAWQQLRGRAMRAMRSWTNECYQLVLLLMSSHSQSISTVDVAPDDADATHEEVREELQNAETLDERSKAFLYEAHQQAQAAKTDQCSFDGEPSREDQLVAKIESGTIATFTIEERMQLVADLMLARNKVTHIYELVKAYGSTTQVHYDRQKREWQRTEAISAKHEREYAVSPLTGQCTAGADHAPLLYRGDPRKDVPSELEAHLIATFQRCDPRIVKGWLQAIATGLGEEEQAEEF
ncbi:MAG: hypothetical protein NVS4B11_23220 [Ktedonobacteraceae bacterium]